MIKIGLFADSHYSTQEKAAGTRRPSLSEGKLREACKAFKESGAELVICLGDLINGEEDDEVNAENLGVITAPLHELRRESGIISLCIRGNHDAEVFTESEFTRISGLMTAPCTVVYGGIRLILLDASFGRDGTPYKKRLIDWTDAKINETQLDWLLRLLSECNEESIYIFTHQNLDPNVEARHIISNAARIREIIAGCAKVRAVYQGHYHKGAYNICGGIPYITLGAMCEGTENSYIVAELI